MDGSRWSIWPNLNVLDYSIRVTIKDLIEHSWYWSWDARSNSRNFQYHYATFNTRNGAPLDAQRYLKSRNLFMRTRKALRTILVLKCKSGLILLGCDFKKNAPCYLLQSGVKMIALYQFLATKVTKRNYFLTREYYTHKEMFLCCTVQEKIWFHHFFNWNIIFLNQRNFFFI